MPPRKFRLDISLFLCAALDGWLAGEDGESIRLRTAKAYDKYQNCGIKAAESLFATGW